MHQREFASNYSGGVNCIRGYSVREETGAASGAPSSTHRPATAANPPTYLATETPTAAPKLATTSSATRRYEQLSNNVTPPATCSIDGQNISQQRHNRQNQQQQISVMRSVNKGQYELHYETRQQQQRQMPSAMTPAPASRRQSIPIKLEQVTKNFSKLQISSTNKNSKGNGNGGNGIIKTAAKEQQQQGQRKMKQMGDSRDRDFSQDCQYEQQQQDLNANKTAGSMVSDVPIGEQQGVDRAGQQPTARFKARDLSYADDGIR